MDPKALARVKQAGSSSIWLPGEGVVDGNFRAIVRRLNAYDDRLVLGRHEQTGDWCVFLTPRANPFGTNEPFPVLGIGRELSSADDVMSKLQKYDSLRQGEKILNEINRENELLQQPFKEAGAEASGIVAEAAESFLHDISKTPYRRVLRPMKQSGVKLH